MSRDTVRVMIAGREETAAAVEGRKDEAAPVVLV
jgi:hypothetical protein